MALLDDVLIRVYSKLNSSRMASTEDITCDPDYRKPFLELAQSEMPDLTEAVALRRLSNLRKRKRLPRFGRIG